MLLRRATLSGLVIAAALTVSIAAPTLANAHGMGNDMKALRDIRGNVVKSTTGHCVLLMNQAGFDNECLGMRREIALEDRTIYFDFNDSSLTEQGKGKLDSLMTILRRDQDVKSLTIVGYADRIGSASYNQALSRKRAMTVRDYLRTNGFENSNVTKTRWVGKSRPSTACKGDKSADLISCLAPDRKVEVEVNYAKTIKGNKPK